MGDETCGHGHHVHGSSHGHGHEHGPGHGHDHGRDARKPIRRAAKGEVKALEVRLGRGVLSGFDPRVKLAAALAMSLVVALCRTIPAATLALGAGLVLALLCGLAPGRLLARFAAVNAFTLFMWVFMIYRIEAAPGGFILAYHPEAYGQAILSALKINAVLFTLIGCLGSTRLDDVLHAMAHLRLPAKLTAVFFLFHRYVFVIHGEYARLRAAMRARCFSPRFDVHTYRCLAYLCGMIFVRAWDRAERVHQAMLCRGFTGTFWLMDHFHARGRDTVFAVAMFLVLGLVVAVDIRERPWTF